jgi:hypothetical protein
LEFKDKSYRGYDTELLVKQFMGSQNSEHAKLNMAIYVLVRDARLLELRPKLEQPQTQVANNANTQANTYRGRKVQFLFKICQLESTKMSPASRLDFS